jgi:RNA polymerase sigma-19 factor, ECF subfamily
MLRAREHVGHGASRRETYSSVQQSTNCTGILLRAYPARVYLGSPHGKLSARVRSSPRGDTFKQHFTSHSSPAVPSERRRAVRVPRPESDSLFGSAYAVVSARVNQGRACKEEQYVNDGELIQGLGAGDPEAFAALFAQHGGQMVGFAQRYVSVEDAEDVISALLAKWLERPPQIRRESLEDFLAVSVRNAARDWIREQARQRGQHPREEGGIAKPDRRLRKPRPSAVPDELFDEIALEAFDQLGSTDREALEVHVERSMSVEEKAAELRITPNAFYQRVFKAVRRWREATERIWNERQNTD